MVPCTPAGCLEILDHYGIPLEGAEAVVVGRSRLVGKPLVQLLVARHATVTTCHTRTRDLAAHCRRADILCVAAGRARKLVHLRADPTITVVVRAGWQWAAVEGTAELIGPDDPHPDVDDERLRVLLREVFTAAGGTHDDWEAYDTVMRDERRTAVLVTPTRVYSNPN